MHHFNRLFYKPTIFILLALAAIAAIWKVEVKWIALPVFLLSGLTIIYQLHTLSLLFDIKYRLEKEKEREKNLLNEIDRVPWPPKKEKLLYYGMQVLFFICVYAISLTGKLVENYLDWKVFILKVLLVGGAMGYICFRLFQYYVNPIFEDDEKENHVKLAAFVIPLLISFHAMVWYNKLQPSPVIATNSVIVSDKGENFLHGNKYIFLHIQHKKVRFEIPNNDFKKIRRNDTIKIVVRKGAIGFNYVDSFLVNQSK